MKWKLTFNVQDRELVYYAFGSARRAARRAAQKLAFDLKIPKHKYYLEKMEQIACDSC